MARDALDRLRVHPVDAGLHERVVQIRSLRALRLGARHRVAGAAVGDEELLALDQVGVVAAARGERYRPRREQGERDRRVSGSVQSGAETSC